MKKRVIAAVAAAAALLSSAPASAQSDTTRAVPYQQVLSANPLGLLFGYYNGEYERAISTTATVGLAGVYFSPEDDALAAIEAKVRYYPQARPFAGFSIGGSLGYGQLTDEQEFNEFVVDSQQEDGETSSAFIVGIEVNYNWLVGRDRRFFIGSGIGARRLVGSDVESDLPVVIPSIRLVNIGFAF